MPHETPLIATISIGLGLAFVFALAAQRLRLPPIVGYLLAGIVVGPFTPGFVADQKLAVELAEIGVILLMFGVGLHFSLKDLMSVRKIAIPGAVGQIAVATVLGMGLAWLLGWSAGAGFVFGLSLLVASTVVLLRALQERRQVDTEKGRIAVGWLIVEDLIMVMTLVLVPPLAGMLGGVQPDPGGDAGLVASLGIGPVWATLLLTFLKIGVFVFLMLVLGRKFIPAVLHFTAHSGSRELFRLAVLAIALGIAFGSAKLFGVSFALGAFFAGMVLSESQLSTQAAKETLPLRDAFAVLFFVSVGMLLNPIVFIEQPVAVLATVLIITLGKSIAAFLIVRSFGHSRGVALTISASLAQIGEFSFILIVLAVNLSIVPEFARDLVVAGSILSILVNPLVFLAIDRLQGTAPRLPSDDLASLHPGHANPQQAATGQTGHAVLIGHGRVGSSISADLVQRGVPLVVVEEDGEVVRRLQASGIEAFPGKAGEAAVSDLLNFRDARYLIVAIPDAFEAGHIVEVARQANPSIHVVARAHQAEEAAYLRKSGADTVLLGEEELARAMSALVKA